jgi:hypothetical protein
MICIYYNRRLARQNNDNNIHIYKVLIKNVIYLFLFYKNNDGI